MSSKFKKGQTPWNKGLTYTPEQTINMHHPHKKFSSEDCRKRSEALKQQYSSGKRKSRRGTIGKRSGRTLYCEICQKELYAAKWEASRRFCSYACMGLSHRKPNPQHSLRMKAFLKQNPDQHLNKKMARQSGFGTRCEKLLSLILDYLNLTYQTQFVVSGKFGDFFLKDYNLIVEVDGDYWHKSSFAERDAVFTSAGYQILHLSAEAVTKGDLTPLLSRLEVSLPIHVHQKLRKQAKSFTGALYTKRRSFPVKCKLCSKFRVGLHVYSAHKLSRAEYDSL